MKNIWLEECGHGKYRPLSNSIFPASFQALHLATISPCGEKGWFRGTQEWGSGDTKGGGSGWGLQTTSSNAFTCTQVLTHALS